MDTVSINVLDQNLQRIAVVDNYTSLIWAKRYYDVGALDLQVEATAQNLDIFRKYNFITRDDDDSIYRIEAIELDTSVEQQNYLIIGAYDCKKILSQRITWNQLNFNGTVENYIRRIITDNVINPSDNLRKINNFALKPAHGFTEEIQAQTQFDELDTKITELCMANKYGWKVTFENGILYFDLFVGVDHSTSQSENNHVVFSPEYDNLSSTKYNMDASDYKNVALVGGEGEGTEKKIRAVGNASGLNRYEMYVSSNVSSNDDGDLVDYYEALIADGKERLAEQSTTIKFEGEIDPTFYKYKIDYNLGDIITIRNEYGIHVNARIVEVAETWNEEGYSIDLIFEYMEVEEAEITGAILTEETTQLTTENRGVLLTEAASRSISDTTSKKISELPAATSAAGDEIVPIVQDGETKGIAISDIFENIVTDLVENENMNPVTSNGVNREIANINQRFSQYFKIKRLKDADCSTVGNTYSLDTGEKFSDWDFIIPIVSTYDSSDKVFEIIPKAEIEYAMTQSGNSEFTHIGTVSGTTRRMSWSPKSDTTFTIGHRDGTSSHLPHLWGFYGVKFGE